ncbi:hypothetical protein MferCBS31731_001345 [Microsporum ferrugineum]
MSSPNDKALQLRNLHIPGKPLVFANVYDAPTARIVAANPSSTALATASYAVAAVHGLGDDDLDLQTNLAAARRIAPIAAEFNKPLSVDMQDGYGSRLEEAIESIIAAGASGCNLEDQDNETGKLFPHDVAVDRVRRAMAAAVKAGAPNFVLNARTDAVLLNKDLEDAIVRGKAFLEAGATTVFVWGGLSRADVERLTKEFGGMLNVSLLPNGLTVQELADIGVARISVGPRMWKLAMNTVEEQSKKLLDDYAAMRAK